MSARPTTSGRGQSLADGAAGVALLHLEERTDPHEWLQSMVDSPVAAHSEATLFDGAPAVAFALAAGPPTRVLADLDEHVAAIVTTRLDAAHRRMDRGELATKAEFDLISGLTGLGAYLLRRHGDGPLVRKVLSYLVRLTEPRPDGLPGWWAAGGPHGLVEGWRGGHGNFGMAHGIAGPLALLAVSARRGVRVTDQTTAMARICQWFDRWQIRRGEAVWWPGALSRGEHDTGVVRRSEPRRPSWCYGTPGICRALQLAGLATGDTNRRLGAERTLASCLADESQLAMLVDVSLCHGWAGTLHTTWRVGRHAEHVRAFVPRLLAGLHECQQQNPTTNHGLLTGQAGARLAHRAATTNTAPATRWDACLLLDE